MTRRAARWRKGSDWEFSQAALREPTQGELEFERVIAQVTRPFSAKKPTPREPTRQQNRAQLEDVRRMTNAVTGGEEGC